ncbi:MAG: radical SAM protein [Candidatus Omnitrophica bacterium]|nr:radical SAM protein [Candidatus Omnitrophota bacterium]
MARVIFIQRIWHEYGGPALISGVLKRRGHSVELFIGNNPDRFLDKILPRDIAAFSIMTGEDDWALEVSGKIKRKKNILTVFGGPHPTYFPEIIEHPSVDVTCCGEGEFAMLDLADSRDKNADYSNIPNLSVKIQGVVKRNEVRPLIPDLDQLPFADRALYYKYPLLRNSPMKPFIVSRGCIFSCNFCFNEKLKTIYSGKGEYVRFRSPKNVVQEIKETESKYGLKYIYFMDDLFVFNKSWLQNFGALYSKEVKKPFACSASVKTLNEENIRLLKDIGCKTVSFGVETGNEDSRKKLLNKHISNAEIEQVASLLKKHKLKFITFNMVGLPGEKARDVLETVKLNIKIRADYPRCSILTPYPGTRIAEMFKDRLNSGKISSLDQQSKISFNNPEARKLKNLHYFFQTAVIFPGALSFIKILISFPPNIVFKIWWLIVYFFIIAKSESRNMPQTLISSLKTFAHSH